MAKGYREYTNTEGLEAATEKLCCGKKLHWCDWAYSVHMRTPTGNWVEDPAKPHSYHNPAEHAPVPCQPRGDNKLVELV